MQWARATAYVPYGRRQHRVTGPVRLRERSLSGMCRSFGSRVETRLRKTLQGVPLFSGADRSRELPPDRRATQRSADQSMNGRRPKSGPTRSRPARRHAKICSLAEIPSAWVENTACDASSFRRFPSSRHVSHRILSPHRHPGIGRIRGAVDERLEQLVDYRRGRRR